MAEITLRGYECDHCKHRWLPRTETPVVCPQCKRRDWNAKGKRVTRLPVPPKVKRSTVVDEAFREAMRNDARYKRLNVDEEIDYALGYKSAKNWTDLQMYVRRWLNRALGASLQGSTVEERAEQRRALLLKDME